MLMQRAERQRAKALKETLRTPGELNYLLMVNDKARLAALRFIKTAEGDFLASGTKSIPPHVLNVAEYFEVPSTKAKATIKKVAKAVRNWRREAATLGIVKHEIERMASAFESADLGDASKF
jgi:hypothetical protein